MVRKFKMELANKYAGSCPFGSHTKIYRYETSKIREQIIILLDENILLNTKQKMLNNLMVFEFLGYDFKKSFT